MLNKVEEKQEVVLEEVAGTELEIEELEQRLEMSCTRCCVDVQLAE